MEGSESEAIFDSLNLNPQLFINAALNIVDELIDSAFDHLHQLVSILNFWQFLFTTLKIYGVLDREASTQLKVNGSDRAEDLTKVFHLFLFFNSLLSSVLFQIV